MLLLPNNLYKLSANGLKNTEFPLLHGGYLNKILSDRPQTDLFLSLGEQHIVVGSPQYFMINLFGMADMIRRRFYICDAFLFEKVTDISEVMSMIWNSPYPHIPVVPSDDAKRDLLIERGLQIFNDYVTVASLYHAYKRSKARFDCRNMNLLTKPI